METVQQLVLVYAGVLLINLALSALLWAHHRSNLYYRDLFGVWASAVVFFLSQAIPGHGALWMALSCLPCFLINYCLANLLGRVAGFPIRKRLYLITLAAAPVLSFVLDRAGGAFWMVALPPAFAVALPILDTPLRAFLRRDRHLTTLGMAAMASALASGLHDLDYPFLRDKPQFAVLGFSISLLIVFAISITAPATVLERVTEERTRMKEQNAFQRRFFSNVTHELRTPLTMILAPIESILREEFGALTATQRSYLEATWRNGVRLLKLVNDLLDLAKLEEGFLKLRVQRTDLHALLRELVEDARPLAVRKNLSLDLVLGEVPEDLHVDAEKIERVVVNLLANAIKFTSTGGVKVQTRVAGGAVEIAIEDTGIGIPPHLVPQLFERFNQGDGSVTRRFGGTGIGLAYAKEIVDLHGGQIEVDSTPGKGSRFTVRLKQGQNHIAEAAREPAAPDATDKEPREWAQRLQRQSQYRFAEIGEPSLREEVAPDRALEPENHILLVEDNDDIRDLIRMHLRDGYAVSTAKDGQMGLEMARRDRPDLVVTDFMMPRMDGVTMLKALRDDPELMEVPVIMLTAKDQLEDRVSGREAGADVYLTKPFSPRELEAAIRRLLEKRGRHVQGLMRAHVQGLEIVSAGLAHEIQNPLNFVRNAQVMIAENVQKLHVALEGLPESDEGRAATVKRVQQKIGRMVETAERGVQRIGDVVALMRRYAREGYPTEPSDVDLDHAISDVVELVAPRGEADFQIVLDLKTSGHVTRVVAEDLNQAIRSLVQNAIEAVGPAGRITLTTRVAGAEAIFEVTDNGPGIAPEHFRRIFSPFHTTKAGSGRGLGLAIVHTVVTRAGGTVEVTSVPNVATTFRIRLPSTLAPLVAPARSSASPIHATS